MAPPRRLLLTSFGPFPGCPVNPTPVLAALVAERLTVLASTEWVIAKETLPVAWDAPAELCRRHAIEPPDALVALGVGARRKRIEVERWAQNVADHARGAQAPDASPGPTRRLHPVIEGGPDRIEGRLHRAPFDGVVLGLAAEGFPLGFSDDAGQYLCNAHFYQILSAFPQMALCGFIHVPHIAGLSVPDGTPGALAIDLAADTLAALVGRWLAMAWTGAP